MQLGSKVRDTVTGFRGIATQRIEYLHGTPRVFVEKALDDGEPAELPPPAKEGELVAVSLGRIADTKPVADWFEEGRLEVTE